MTDDRHKRFEIRAARRESVVRGYTTVPADLELAEPHIPQWTRPSPRRTYCTPLIQYQRTHWIVRHLCARIPALKPLMRRVF